MSNESGRQASQPITIPQTVREGSRETEEVDEHLSTAVEECGFGGIARDLSHLPQTLPHFVNRKHEYETVMNYLVPTNECRCVLLNGAPGIGKTSLAIKVANELLKTNPSSVVVYVNCKYIVSFDDFAGKVVQQIYHYPLNDPISAMDKRLRKFDFYMILLLDNFEFLMHLKDRNRENPLVAETVHAEMNRGACERTKVTEFIADAATSFRNVKLLVTSSEDVTFPKIGKRRMTLNPFRLEESLQLLTKVCDGELLNYECASQLVDICSGIPLVLYTLMSSDDDLVSRVQQMRISQPAEQFEYLEKIKVVSNEDKINVCLDVCFNRLSPEQQNTLVKLAIVRGWFTPSGAAKVFQSSTTSKQQFIGLVLELAGRSLLQRNIIFEGERFYTFLSVIREYCKRKAVEERFGQVYRDARNAFTDHFLAFLKDSFKMFLSKNARRAITEFRREEENIMQLLEWIEKGEVDEERMKRCIDVFNMVGELLAKMMGKTKYKFVYELLTRKCEDMRDQRRLSECLTSLGIKEVFDCSCLPGLCDAASARAKSFLEKADRIQTQHGINKGNSRAQCLAKLGRCLAKEGETRKQGKAKIREAISIRQNAVRASNDEEDGKDVCRVMLGATHNDMGVALSLEEDHRQAVKIREEQVLPIYGEILGYHPFGATILNNLSNNYYALRKFDNAKQHAEAALKIRLELLKDHKDTAKSLFDLGMIHKEKKEFKEAKKYLERCKTMHENMLDDNIVQLQRTKQELEDICKHLNDRQS